MIKRPTLEMSFDEMTGELSSVVGYLNDFIIFDNFDKAREAMRICWNDWRKKERGFKG